MSQIDGNYSFSIPSSFRVGADTLTPGLSKGLATISDREIASLLNHPVLGQAGERAGIAERYLATGMAAPRDTGGSSVAAFTEEIAARSAQPFDLSEVNAIFLEFMLSYRQAARLDRESALESQISAMLSSAEQIRKAAAEQYKAELVQAIFSIIGSAVQLGFASMQIRSVNTMRKEIRASEAEVKTSSRMLKTGLTMEGGGPEGSKPSSPAKSKADTVAEGEADTRSRESNRKSVKNQEEVVDEVRKSQKLADDGRSADSIKQSEIDLMAEGFEIDLSGKPSSKPATVPAFREFKARLDAANASSQALNALGNAMSGIASMPGKIWGGLLSADAGETRARGQEYDANAKRAEAAYANANDTMQNARETFNKMLDMQADIQRTLAETARSITRI